MEVRLGLVNKQTRCFATAPGPTSRLTVDKSRRFVAWQRLAAVVAHLWQGAAVVPAVPVRGTRGWPSAQALWLCSFCPPPRQPRPPRPAHTNERRGPGQPRQPGGRFTSPRRPRPATARCRGVAGRPNRGWSRSLAVARRVARRRRSAWRSPGVARPEVGHPHSASRPGTAWHAPRQVAAARAFISLKAHHFETKQ